MRPNERAGRIRDGLGVRSGWWAGLLIDNVLPGATIWAISIRPPIWDEPSDE